MLSVQPGLRGSNDLHVGRKMANFQLFFFSRVGLRTYQHSCTCKWSGFFPLLKSKLSGMSMWIWLCRHRTYNLPHHAPFSRKTLYNHLYHFEFFEKTLWTRYVVPLFLSVGESMELINLQTCMCVYTYTSTNLFQEILFKRLLCIGGLTAISIISWWSLAFSYTHSLLNFVVMFLTSVWISSCNSKPLTVRNLCWSRITESNSSNKLLHHWRIEDWHSTFSFHNMNCSVLILTDSKVLSSGIWRLVHSLS